MPAEPHTDAGALQGLLVLLVLLVLASALGVAYTTHQGRKLFVELQALQATRDELNIEWGRLLLEQSTLATPPLVERIARRELGMHAPLPEQIRVVRPAPIVMPDDAMPDDAIPADRNDEQTR